MSSELRQDAIVVFLRAGFSMNLAACKNVVFASHVQRAAMIPIPDKSNLYPENNSDWKYQYLLLILLCVPKQKKHMHPGGILSVLNYLSTVKD